MIPFFWLLRIFEKTKYILADKWVDDNIAQFVQTYYAKWDKNGKILLSIHSVKQEILLVLEANQGMYNKEW